MQLRRDLVNTQGYIPLATDLRATGRNGKNVSYQEATSLDWGAGIHYSNSCIAQVEFVLQEQCDFTYALSHNNIKDVDKTKNKT